jgi:hypothetical protein
MFDEYIWIKIDEALYHATRNAHQNNKREWARIAEIVRNEVRVKCHDCPELVKLGSKICSKCAAAPWVKLGELVETKKAELGYTAETYAEKIIKDVYPVPNEYGLSIAIAKVSSRLSHWIEEHATRANYAFMDGVNNDYIAEQQAESSVKRDAYRLALNNLTRKLVSGD